MLELYLEQNKNAMNQVKANLLILLLAIAAIFVILSLDSCKKEDPKPSSWVVTFKITGVGTYHYQADLSRQGHVGNPGEPTSFIVAAQKGTLIELDAIADTLGQSISIKMDIKPMLGDGTYQATGTGRQQIQYQN